MSTRRLLRLGALLLASLAVVQAMAADSEQQMLLQQQREMKVRFDVQLQACSSRFFVTDCVEEVQRQRRVSLAPLTERLLQIDAAERLRRAAERQGVLAVKNAVRVQRQASAPAEDSVSAASAPRSGQRQRLLPGPGPQPPETAKPASSAKAASRADAAAARASQAQERQAQVTERQKQVAKRLAERQARQKAPAGLPPP